MIILEVEKQEAVTEAERIPVCLDFDEDCEYVEDHLACWLYDMGKGMCPYCSSCEDK